MKLRPMKLPKPPYEVHYIFAVSSVQADIDNPVKTFQDVLQDKYGFNDKDVFKMTVEKVIVNKGDEYIKFDIQHYEEAKDKAG